MELKHQIEVILRNATRLKKIVEELSEVNSFESSPPNTVVGKPVDMGKLIGVNGRTARALRITISSQPCGTRTISCEPRQELDP